MTKLALSQKRMNRNCSQMSTLNSVRNTNDSTPERENKNFSEVGKYTNTGGSSFVYETGQAQIWFISET